MSTHRLKTYAELVKLEHTVFALPFALAGVFIMAEGFPSWSRILWILVALVGARTLGMALNRLIDRDYDARNPRTKSWVHVRGDVSVKEIWGIIILSSAVFLLSAYMINTLAFILSPIVIAILVLYPYAKRFTYFPHLFLALVYLLIPVAVDVALNERVSVLAVVLGTAMATWVAGFDALYALQDYEFDRSEGLKSVAVKLGKEGAIKFARGMHILTLICLILVGLISERLSVIYFLGLLPITLFLIYEHRLVKPTDLSKLNKAFFTVNGYVSIAFFLVVLADYIL